MANPVKKLFTIASLPGIKRDGTTLDGDNYSDGQWVRFQRGRPKKMGGYQRITGQLRGPIRDVMAWSRAGMNALYSFSPYGIETVLVDNNGLGASIIDRSPSGFTSNSNAVWSTDTQYDDAVGSQGTVVLAHCSSSLANIDDTTATKPFLGLASADTAFAEITDAPAVSGGVFSVAPYTFVHGSDGFLAWSDINQPQVWYTSAGNIGDAGADRVTGAKIVKGLPLRSGAGPAGLLWSLDSVLRFDYTGGGTIFKFTHLSTQTSILSQNSVVEYDGLYFWLGIDRFLVCDGGQVKEVPNQMNINWFYDNLNYSQRQKVWGMKIPRYGEIMWFFPYGDATECDRCVIYNVREQTWYDSANARSAGFYSQVFRYPVMARDVPAPDGFIAVLSSVAGTIADGDLVIGSTSGNTATVTRIDGTSYYFQSALPNQFFTALEGVTSITSGGTATVDEVIPLYSMYLHEKGRDAVIGDSVTAIESYVTTADFGFPTGGAQPNQPEGVDRWTRVTRVEPDFLQTGDMCVQVTGREFANAPETTSLCYNFTDETERIDMREQRREIRLKFTSNTIGGHFEMGRVILHLELGDVRS